MLKDAEKTLDAADHNHRGEASVKEFETEVGASLTDRGRWLLVDVNSASVRVVLPTPTSINKQILWVALNTRGRRRRMQRFLFTYGDSSLDSHFFATLVQLAEH